MTHVLNVGDKVTVTGDLKMGTVTEVIKESSGEARKVRIQYGDGASEWYMAEEVQKLLLEW
tara:strand:- start:410 stop:592 length:183 start_codon:yes stop_codon:yes gene_type:complete